MKTEYEQFRQGLLEWSQGNLRQFPWRNTNDPYEVLLAEILLQQTPAERVEPIYRDILCEYTSPNDLAKADTGDLAAIIQPLGLQNRRAHALVEIGKKTRQEGIPQNETELLELPNVGKYVANATLCFAYGESRAVADSNVIRVYERAFDRDFYFKDSETWEFAQKLLPEEHARRYNLALIDFADAVCRSTAPDCTRCFFSEICEYYQTKKDNSEDG